MEIVNTNNKHGINLSNLDTEISPSFDFYQYACGGWMKANPLTAEYSRYGMFDFLREKNRLQVKELILGLADSEQSRIKGTNAQKVSDLYLMAMDTERRNAEGAKPLESQIKRINSMTEEDFIDVVAWLHNGIASVFFSTGVGSDPKNSDMNIMHIGEGPLTLGDRDYYLEKNETNDKIMEAYQLYVKKLMKLIGYSEEEQQRVWENVIAIETFMAQNKKTREQRRDPLLSYNLRGLNEITRDFSSIDWNRYFKILNIVPPESANVASPSYLEALNKYLPTLSLQAKKDFMVFNAVDEATGLLSDDFFDASFELFDKIMSGKEEPQPLWKRAMGLATSILGEAVGALYVEKYFPKENKDYMVNLVENLRKALGQHIDNLTWMSDATKSKAREKLSAMKVKIGYPDKWKDYSGIVVNPEISLLENVLEASKWYVRDNYSKLGKPVDKSEWHMTPQTVNAYYSPVTNEICFPAGILQAPYFDITADDALNYGAIGVIIGHEMTHGFDDQGRQFDKDGNLSNWWTEEDAKKFNSLADKLVEQFNAIEVLPGLHANGRYTLGENIADQGGLRIALTAYQKSQEEKETENIDGFTPLQRFYLSYGQIWASNIRKQEIEVCTKTDPHSLAKLRVNATLKNISQFFDAFGIIEGNKMYLSPDKRVIIW